MSAWAPTWLRASGVRVVYLPARSRSPSRLARLLQPAIAAEPLEALVWLICRGPHCHACVWPAGEYRVSLRRARAYDRLSGLTHEVVVEARGHVGDGLVWTARWDGSFLVVEDFNCMAVVLPDGRVRCSDGQECTGPPCLARCVNRASAGSNEPRIEP